MVDDVQLEPGTRAEVVLCVSDGHQGVCAVGGGVAAAKVGAAVGCFIGAPVGTLVGASVGAAGHNDGECSPV